MPLFALLAVILALSFSLFYFRHKSNQTNPLTNFSQLMCEGVVSDFPRAREWGVIADVKLLNCRGRARMFVSIKGNSFVRLYLSKEDADLLPYEKIVFRTKFSLPREYKNPGSFSYKRYLLVHGITLMGRVYGKVERLGSANELYSWIGEKRLQVSRSIEKVVAPTEAGILKAMAIGDQDGIDPKTRDTFASTGLAHILAISGMNVGYVAAFIYFLSRFLLGRFSWLLLRIPLRSLASIVTIPLVWLYVIFTGDAISAVRAGIMITIFLVGVVALRRQDLLSTLCTSVIVILLFLPLSLFDVSFQLSVIAVLGIILIAPRFVSLLGGEPVPTSVGRRIFRWTVILISVTLAAAVSTTPIIAYHFKFLSGLSIFANLIAVPLFGAILSPLAAIASQVVFVSQSAADILWMISGILTSLFLGFAKYIERIGNALILRWAPTLLETVFIYAAVAVVLYWGQLKKRRVVVILLTAIFMCDVGYWNILPLVDHRLEITVIDVGQGDSTFIRFPDGTKMLVDGGGLKGSSFDIGKNVIAPFLWSRGIYRIDYILLTHPHYDHYAGLKYIMQQFQPKVFWTSGLAAPDAEEREWEDFEAAVQLSGSQKEILNKEYLATIGGVALKVVGMSDDPMGRDINDASLILRLTHGANSFLFTGDLTAAGEEEYLKKYGDVRAEFLKIGHHGSASSSSGKFLRAVSPDISVISVGGENRYGMPSEKVLDRLKKTSSSIYRTDISGAITVKSDGRKISVD